MSQRVCPECGAVNVKDAIYCQQCGARVGGGTCQCGAELPAGARHCVTCGRPVEGAAAAGMGRRAERRPDAGIRWVRSEQEVAARLAPSDLLGRLRSGLEVQPGTRALLFLGGRYVGTLPPGRHTIEGVLQKLKLPTDGEPVAVVVDDGELGLEFSVGDLHSADHRNVVLHAQASIRLTDAEVFLANLFRDRATFTVADLAAFLEGEIRESLRELVAGHDAADLQAGRVRGEMEMELLSRWKATLDRTGFTLNRFRVLRFELPGLEVAEDVLSQAGDATTVLAAGRTAREAYFDADLSEFTLDTAFVRRRGAAQAERVRAEGEAGLGVKRADVDVELDAMKVDLDRLERRQKLYPQLLTDSMLERMTELKTEEEWRKFRAQVDRDRLIDDHTWDELRKDTQAKAATGDVRRQYLFKRFAAMAQSDLDELALKQTYALKLLEMRGDTDVVREQVARERLRLDHDLAARGAAFQQQLSERERWFQQEYNQQRSVADLQMWKVERLEALRQMSKDREAARELQQRVTLAEAERKRLQTLADATVGKSSEEIVAAALLLGPAGGGTDAGSVADTMKALKGVDAAKREAELLRESRDRETAIWQGAQTLDHDKFKESVDADERHRALRESLDEQEKSRLEGVAVAGLTADDKKKVPWVHCEIHDQKYLAGRECPLCLRDRKGSRS